MHACYALHSLQYRVAAENMFWCYINLRSKHAGMPYHACDAIASSLSACHLFSRLAPAPSLVSGVLTPTAPALQLRFGWSLLLIAYSTLCTLDKRRMQSRA